MSVLKRELALPLGFALAAALILVGHEAFGRKATYAPASHVATVDLGKVFERINVNKSWEVEIMGLAERLNSEANGRQEAIGRKLEDAQKATSEPDAQKIRDSAALMKLEMDEWAKLKQLELDRERALMWKAMYKAIRTQTNALAMADGWDIVLVNDSLGELNLSNEVNASREQQILTQILNRRLLYASELTDVTEQLIVRINNLKP
jgi:Skp family chaperone for outer membrane proteins